MSEGTVQYPEAEAALKEWRVKGPQLLSAYLFKMAMSGSLAITYLFYCAVSFFFSKADTDFEWLFDYGWIGVAILAVIFVNTLANYQNEIFLLERKAISQIIPLVDPKLVSGTNSPLNSKEFSSLDNVELKIQQGMHSSVFCLSGNSDSTSFSIGMLRQRKPDSEFDKNEDIFCIRFDSSVCLNRTDASFPQTHAFEDIIKLSVTDTRPFAFKNPNRFLPENNPGLYTSDLENSNEILEVLKQCTADIRRKEKAKQIFLLSFGNTRLILFPLRSTIFRTRNGFARLTLADDILPQLQTIRDYVGLAAKLDAALQNAADAVKMD